MISQALGWSDEERNWVLEGDDHRIGGAPSAKDRFDQWQELLAYMRHQSNVSDEVEQRRAAANAAIAAEDYDRAQSELTEIAQALYRGAAYHTEEYARALAALGALAFTRLNYADARLHYGKAIELGLLPEKRLERYQRSYRIASNACMTQAEARAILKEMEEKGVTPNVVSYSTLLTFAGSEAEARAILKEMEEKGVTPDEPTLTTIIKNSATFETALALVDFFLLKKYFVGRGAFEAAFAKPITHLTAEELLTEYSRRAFKFDSSLQSAINQYRRAGQADHALAIVLFAPHVGASQKFYREEYDLCKEYFRSEIVGGNNDDNLFYAFGIAAALNSDWENAKPNLQIALNRAYAQKRISHIKELLFGTP